VRLSGIYPFLVYLFPIPLSSSLSKAISELQSNQHFTTVDDCDSEEKALSGQAIMIEEYFGQLLLPNQFCYIKSSDAAAAYTPLLITCVRCRVITNV
jgi:hypothetical protein